MCVWSGSSLLRGPGSGRACFLNGLDRGVGGVRIGGASFRRGRDSVGVRLSKLTSKIPPILLFIFDLGSCLK